MPKLNNPGELKKLREAVQKEVRMKNQTETRIIIGLGTCLTLYFIGHGIPKGEVVAWYFTAPGAGTVGMFVSLLVNPLFSSFCCKGSCRN